MPDQPTPDLWHAPEQAHTSERTSINATKLPASIQAIQWKPGTRNADIGGGRFDNVTQHLQGLGVENVIWDPYNRPQEHNQAAAGKLRGGQAHTATVNNVLNVIQEPHVRQHVIRLAADALRPDGTAHFLIYEGNKQGTGGPTAAGWQEHRHAATYEPEIAQHFGVVKRRGNLIYASQPRKSEQYAAGQQDPWDAFERYAQQRPTRPDPTATKYAAYLAIHLTAGTTPRSYADWRGEYERAQYALTTPEIDHEDYSLDIQKFDQDPWSGDRAGSFVHDFDIDSPRGRQHYKAKLQLLTNTGRHGIPNLGKSYEFAFGNPEQKQEAFGITGTGSAPHVMSHAASIVLHSLSNHRPASIEFAANELSRRKLYHKMVSRVSQANPEYIAYTVNNIPVWDQEPKKAERFAVVHRDYAPLFEEHQKAWGKWPRQLVKQEQGKDPARYSMTAQQVKDATSGWTPPSKAQLEAGNYAKPTISWKGLTIKIETPKGERRRPEWPPMPAHYGYFVRVGQDAVDAARDGDKPDVFVAQDLESDLVVVIDQETPGGRFDEWKVIVGCTNQQDAMELYRRAYTPGWRVGPATSMTVEQFKAWLADMPSKRRIAEQVSRYTAKAAEPEPEVTTEPPPEPAPDFEQDIETVATKYQMTAAEKSQLMERYCQELTGPTPQNLDQDLRRVAQELDLSPSELAAIRRQYEQHIDPQ